MVKTYFNSKIAKVNFLPLRRASHSLLQKRVKDNSLTRRVKETYVEAKKGLHNDLQTGAFAMGLNSDILILIISKGLLLNIYLKL